MSPIVNREQKAFIILKLTEMPITSLRIFYMRDYFEKQHPDMLTNKKIDESFIHLSFCSPTHCHYVLHTIIQVLT